jgi:hypothetical protein
VSAVVAPALTAGSMERRLGLRETVTAGELRKLLARSWADHAMFTTPTTPR